jgi:hypothetical protein
MAHFIFDVVLLCRNVVGEEQQRLALKALLPKKRRALPATRKLVTKLAAKGSATGRSPGSRWDQPRST